MSAQGVGHERGKEVSVCPGRFLACFYLPVENLRFGNAIFEAFSSCQMVRSEHVILCLVPAFFIAELYRYLFSQASVMKYFGAKRISFSHIAWLRFQDDPCRMLMHCPAAFFRNLQERAGLGPAVAFLYSGPAINVLAIILTARILGWQLGLARAVGAVVFSVVIGLLMHLIS